MEDFKRKELCSLKKDEKVCSTKIFKCFEKFSFILEFLASILLSTLIFKFICNYMHFNCVSKTMLVFIVMVSIIILFLVFFNIKKNKKIENVFLSFMIPLGIMYATFVLVYKVPDEQAHAYRAYNISNFKIIGDTKLQEESVPTQMRSLEDVANYYDEYQLLNVKADYASQSDKEFNVCMTYPPLVYIMPSLTFFVCRMLNINILIAIYLARISNFIMFLFTGWICLKKIPFGKIAVLVYLFMPMMIHQVASISADAFINCISLAFVTYVLYLKFENEKFDKKHKIIFILLAIGLAFTKHIYFPIAFIALILVFDKKLDKKSKAFIIITMALVTIIAVGWFLFSNVYKDVREYILVNEVSLTNQLKYILKNPIKFIDILCSTTFIRGGTYTSQLIGSNLGLLTIKLNNFVIVLYLLLILVSPFLEKHNYALNFKERLLFVIIAVGIFLLILTGLYLSWTLVGKDIIDGVQGRYFIPIAILPLLCLVIRRKNIEIKNVSIYVASFAFLFNLYAISKIIIFFS